MAGEGAGAPKPKSELTLRIMSAIVLAIGAIGSTWAGGLVFTLVWGVVFAFVLREWFNITLPKVGATNVWTRSGLAYAFLPLTSVLLLRLSDSHGMATIFFLFAVVWGADVGAYFAGRTIGGPKLAPSISPNKTWSGLIGGVVTAVLAGMLMLKVLGYSIGFGLALLAAVLALVSAMGDLFESHLKRRFGVKDSGQTIPGHGGFMDRLDGFIFAAVLAALIGLLRGGFNGVGGGLLTGW